MRKKARKTRRLSERESFIEDMRRIGRKAAADPKYALELLMKAGIYTKDDKLTERYRLPSE